MRGTRSCDTHLLFLDLGSLDDVAPDVRRLVSQRYEEEPGIWEELLDSLALLHVGRRRIGRGMRVRMDDPCQLEVTVFHLFHRLQIFLGVELELGARGLMDVRDRIEAF